MTSRQESDDGHMADFYKYLGKVKDVIGEEGMKKFEELTTDENRVEFVWNIDAVHRLLEITPLGGAKCQRTAERHRTQANLHMKQKEYSEALRSINVGIVFSQYGSEQHASSCAIRSAVLFQLQRFTECIADIDAALEWNYPEKLRYKLYERMGLSYLSLLQQSEAIASFQKAIECLECSELGTKNREKLKKALQQKCDNCRGADLECIASKKVTVASSYLHDVTHGSETMEPFEVRYDPACGRYCTAKRDLAVGDTVLTEHPFCAVLHRSYHPTHCHHCFRQPDVLYACKQCSSVIYCSETCRKASWDEYHALECEVLGWLGDNWAGHLGALALRISAIAGQLPDQHDETDSPSVLPNFEKHVQQNLANVEQILGDKKDDPTSELSDPTSDVSDTKAKSYAAICDLVGHDNDRGASDLLQITLMAIFLFKLVSFSKKTNRKDDGVELTEHDQRLCGTLMKHLKIVQCNAFSIAHMKKVKDFRKCSPEDVGMGMYEKASLVNHSCDPSMDVVYHGNVSQFRVIKDVNAGRELTIDYGKQFTTHPKSLRQKALESQYFFTCKCMACLHDWPTFDHIESDDCMFICRFCRMILPPLMNKSQTSVKCSNCKRKCNLGEVIRKLATSHDQHMKALDNALRWDFKKALPALQRHLSLMQQNIALPWQEFHSCQATIKQCYQLMACSHK